MKNCGTCRFNCYDFYPAGYYCSNQESDKAGNNTCYSDSCDHWEEEE